MKNILFFISLERQCFACQLEGIYRYSRNLNWHVQVVENQTGRQGVKAALSSWKPNGVISEYSDRHNIRPSLFAAVPVVYIDIGRLRLPSRGNFVGLDSGEVGRIGAKKLLELDLSSYAYVGFWSPVPWDRERCTGFENMIRRASRPCRTFLSSRGSSSVDRHQRLCEWLKSLPRPCGVMACNDRVGEEVLNACSRLGLHVPEDIAVLGVDNDTSLCENTKPSLASIDPGTSCGGFLAAQMLDKLMARGRTDSHSSIREFFVPLGVVTRQSIRRISCDRSKVSDALEMIRRKACEGIGVGDVVARMGVSRRAAEKHFRLATGRTILDEINEVRFAKVFELLRDERRPIDTIAGFCGFSTEVALRKAFRLRMGKSMSEWRKQARRNG